MELDDPLLLDFDSLLGFASPLPAFDSLLDFASLPLAAAALPDLLSLPAAAAAPLALAPSVLAAVSLVLAVELLGRESFLYQPDPLNTMPTGWITLRTGWPQRGHSVIGSAENDWMRSNT